MKGFTKLEVANIICGLILSIGMLIIGFFFLNIIKTIIVVVSSFLVWFIFIKLEKLFNRNENEIKSNFKLIDILMLIAELLYFTVFVIFFFSNKSDFNMLTFVGLFLLYLLGLLKRHKTS